MPPIATVWSGCARRVHRFSRRWMSKLMTDSLGEGSTFAVQFADLSGAAGILLS